MKDRTLAQALGRGLYESAVLRARNIGGNTAPTPALILACAIGVLAESHGRLSDAFHGADSRDWDDGADTGQNGGGA